MQKKTVVTNIKKIVPHLPRRTEENHIKEYPFIFLKPLNILQLNSVSLGLH